MSTKKTVRRNPTTVTLDSVAVALAKTKGDRDKGIAPDIFAPPYGEAELRLGRRWQAGERAKFKDAWERACVRWVWPRGAGKR